jgi:site-specific recombinase XerD
MPQRPSTRGSTPPSRSHTQQRLHPVGDLASHFELSLQAANKAPRTVSSYLEALTLFSAFLSRRRLSPKIETLAREDVEAFIADQVRRHKPTTAAVRFRSLQQFFRWAVEEDFIAESPMAKLKAPHVPETPPDVITDAQLKRQFAACEGKAFVDRRDMAMIRLLLDTGIRRAELARLTVGDIDWDVRLVSILAKGRRPRRIHIGIKTAQSLERYIRIRAHHKDAHLPNLFLGRAGPITDSGVYQLI